MTDTSSTAPIAPLVHYTRDEINAHRRVLELLAQKYGNINEAATEIINLEAILSLPKGTEHFVADIHGEWEAFQHILKNASGDIKRKVREIFEGSLREDEIRQLCTLIYYPKRKLDLIRATEKNMDDFYQVALHRLVRVLQRISSKYTRSKVRKALPREFAYIIEELLHEADSTQNKRPYYQHIIDTIISTGQADEFIKAISHVIQHLAIDRLHILGDIYDRGPGAHLILDILEDYKDYDIQWGNHDVLWMGAAAGNLSSIANVLRISLRYANLETLEDGYGINLVPLAMFATETYAQDPCTVFKPKTVEATGDLPDKNQQMIARMHKAIAVIQFKLEGQLIAAHPEWGMDDRRLLHRIDFEHGTVDLGQRGTHKLKDSHFPTVDPADPYRLTPEEDTLIRQLAHSFTSSGKLARHMRLMLAHGSMYKVTNNNLLFHASVPLNSDGSLRYVNVLGHEYAGPELLHAVEETMRLPFAGDASATERQQATDYYWYLWCGPESPLFDKACMATFERYLITDKGPQKEEKGWYYKLRDDAEVCDTILDAFGITGPHRHIINGHVPVKTAKGESPIKGGGELMVIDGGFAKAYHDTTGIAGYTLVYHSRGFELVQHQPFSSAEEAVREGTDIIGTTQIVEQLNQGRARVGDTDTGRELRAQIAELRELLFAYRNGIIKERK